jgi:hypothetical protein
MSVFAPKQRAMKSFVGEQGIARKGPKPYAKNKQSSRLSLQKLLN